MSQATRRNELHARRTRRQRLRKLRERYVKAKSAVEKEQIMAKVARVAPGVSSEQFLAPIKAA